jgi:hypothetical protein
MGKEIKLVVLVILVLFCVIFLLSLLNRGEKEGLITMKQPTCDSNGCPVPKSQNNIYKLHVQNKKPRDNNHAISHKTELGNFFYKAKGPANIFIIRHGEKIKSKIALDCNGILRSTYIPDMVINLNEQGYGIHCIVTTNDYSSMHQQQTVMLASWLYSIPLFIYGVSSECEIAIQTIFSNPYFSGKTVLLCWEHTCIQELVQNIITIGAKVKGLDNYVFKNPNGTSELPYWDTNNYRSVFHFDNDLNFSINEERLSTCYKNDNDLIEYGENQVCKS